MIKKLFIFCIIFFQGFISLPVKSMDMVSFDPLFPALPLKKTLDTCMQIWADVRALNSFTHKSPHYQEAHDMIVGRLVRLNSYIDQIIQELNEGASFTRTDIDYLLSIIDYITYERTRNDVKVKYSDVSAIAQLIGDARKKMLSLL